MKWYYNYMVLLLMFPAGKAAAQDRYSDSLLNVLRRNANFDSLRVDRIILLTEYPFLKRNTKDSLITEGNRISDSLHYTTGKACLLALRALYVDSDEKKAEIAGIEAVKLARSTGDLRSIATTLLAFGFGQMNSVEKNTSINALRQGLQAAVASGDISLQARLNTYLAQYYVFQENNYVEALGYALRALNEFESAKQPDFILVDLLRSIGDIYTAIGDRTKALLFMQRSLKTAQDGHFDYFQAFVINDLGALYLSAGDYTTAIASFKQALLLFNDGYSRFNVEGLIADAYSRMNQNSLALAYAHAALRHAQQFSYNDLYAGIDKVLARTSLQIGRTDSAIYYGKMGYAMASSLGNLVNRRDNAEVLANAYDSLGKYENAYRYFNAFIKVRDSLNNQEVSKKSQQIQYQYDLDKKQSEIDLLNKDRQLQQAEARRERTALTAALAGLGLVGILLFLIARHNRQRRRAYGLLQRQKQEIQDQRDQTASALRELRQTQQQLIQSEKMASLGELTAGVAHEIQNPLNFVNNFAELDIELMAELKAGPLQALLGPAREEADGLIADISDNLGKIAWHGGRADAIVKGMLAHSRTGSGQKEPTDLNALADECLRLSYHGFRAKDKSFNASLVTEFDPAIGFVELIRQDISRVLLNLCTNAFYSVAKKSEQAGADFRPTVAVETRRDAGVVVITVEDNGMGIPENVVDKIYQPFFTTKPTGEGTGLGLSLSYDIIKKGHGGELTVATKEGEYATFIITISG